MYPPTSARILALGMVFLIAILAMVAVSLEAVIVDKKRQDQVLSFETTQNQFVGRILKLLTQPWLKLSLKSFFILAVFYFLAQRAIRIFKLTQPGTELYDFRWFYVAGNLINRGINPYQPKTFMEHFVKLTTPDNATAFVYPPSVVPLVKLVGDLPLTTASTLWVILNSLAIGFLLWGAIKLLDSQARVMQVTCVVAGLLIYGTTYNVRVGNISALLAAFLVWAIVLARKDRNLIAGILLGITTIKPTLSLLFLLYFLVKRRYRLVFTHLVTSSILIVVGLIYTQNFSLGFLDLYRESYQLWASHEFNNAFTSSGRIDIGVVGPRLFNSMPILAKLVSTALSTIPLLLTFTYLYKKRKSVHSSTIDLLDISLIACLNLMSNYAQPVNSVLLILPFVYLMNFLLAMIQYNSTALLSFPLWAGMICLLVHSNFMYYFTDLAWQPMVVSGIKPFLKTMYATLPNLSLLGLTFCMLALANISFCRHRGAVEVTAINHSPV